MRRRPPILLILVLAGCLAAGPASLAAAQPEAPAEDVAEEADATPEEAEAAEEPEEDPLVAEAAELERKLEESTERENELEEKTLAAIGEARLLLEEQLFQQQLQTLAALRGLGENLLEQREAGRDISASQAFLQEQVRVGWPVFRDTLAKRVATRLEKIAARDAATGEEQIALAEEVQEASARILSAYQTLVEWLTVLAPLDIELTEPRSFAETSLSEIAERRAAAVRVALRKRDALARSAARAPDDADLKRELQTAEDRADLETKWLSSVASLLDRLGLETAEYRQLLFASTGEITTDVLDRDVALGLLQQWRDRLASGFEANGPRWFLQGLVFVLIILAFRGLASITRSVVKRSVSSGRVRLSQLLGDTLVSWSGRLVTALGLLIALSQIGVQIGPLLAGLGIAGFVLGFALQDSLSNFAAGAMILAYRPYDVGDVIEAAGVTGKVSAMSLVSTTFLTFDNQTLIVPNSKIWGDVIRNVTAQRIRRVDLVFGVGYGEDVDRVDAVLRELLAKHEKVLDQPEPIVEVHNLGESSVDFVCRPWVRTEDYWGVYWGLTRAVKKRFDQEGISIPFPQRDVHLHVPKPSDDA